MSGIFKFPSRNDNQIKPRKVIDNIYGSLDGKYFYGFMMRQEMEEGMGEILWLIVVLWVD